MRGVVSGANENHSGSQPSVGTYLDEQPVTTIDGTPDVHLYDIQRIEVLEGPQGTLYGASSEAGTVRIITNKPDPTKFSGELRCAAGSRSVTGHRVRSRRLRQHTDLGCAGGPPGRLLRERWRDTSTTCAGTNASACIVNGVRTFPSWAGQPPATGTAFRPQAAGLCPVGPVPSAAKSPRARRRHDRCRGHQQRGLRQEQLQRCVRQGRPRGAQMGRQRQLERDAQPSWSSRLSAKGFFGYDPAVGDLQLAHFGPESSNDTFIQSALTVEGKFSNFDLTYAGAFMKRHHSFDCRLQRLLGIL